MATQELLVVPTELESNFCNENGDKGNGISDAFKLEDEAIGNIYSYSKDTGEFIFAFQEKGVAYDEDASSTLLSRASFKVTEEAAGVLLKFICDPIAMWGINYCGVIEVKHQSGETRRVYIPGTRTYDPAGRTGDPHASERIGPSCSRTQAAVTLAQMYAVKVGATLEQINSMQEATRAAILRYHGRETLFDWMKLQFEEAIYQNKDVTPYPEFIKKQIASGKIELTSAMEHTKVYLESYDAGNPCPPDFYYKKVAAKDNYSVLFQGGDLERFNQIIGK